MKKPFLIAETPRAGNRGHRFIVPTGLEISSSDLELFFQKATRQNRGRNFLSVNRQVKQLLTSGSVRTGTETLMLAGIETAALNPQEIDNLDKTLQKRLIDLEQLVTTEINWEKDGQNTMVIRKELTDWSRENGMDKLSAFIPISWVKSNKYFVRGSMLGILTGAIILYLYLIL
ncbi:MAG: hypothetical protein KKB30_07410 [Proteobacteria bacterium]|nr:hypothetical protein [Pseudomonadota bacterium]MBU1714972.1 hypothetical protein [Pseudomonadota bacterium]